MGFDAFKRSPLNMKKYVAVWGALFFFVICISLYLMLETINTSPGRFQRDVNGESLDTFEQKINEIQSDIDLNKETIKEIRQAVKGLGKGDQDSYDKLKGLISNRNEILKQDSLRVQQELGGKDLPKNKGNVAVVNMDQKPLDTPVRDSIGAVVQYDAKTWRNKYATLRSEVKVDREMCTWADAPKAKREVETYHLMETLPFDNPDGGAWKQGWAVTYPESEWNTNRQLKVFVVPHSHNDPGWVKTYETYYRDQTKHILDLALQKLQQYPKGRFIYAEISFFHMWWNELGTTERQQVKKLINEGRWEIVTGGWVMNDEANAHYFAMLDQMIEGHQWLDGTLGVKPESGWAIDPFGHTPTMAYLLRRSGFNGMLIQRVHYAVKKYLAKNKLLEFMWRQTWDHEGNTDMLCHMMPFYSYDVPHTCGPEPAVCCQFDFRRLPGSSYNCPWRIPPVPITNSNVAERSKLLIDQWKKKASLYRSESLFIPLGDDFRYDKAEEWDQQFTNYFKIFDYLQAHPELGVNAQFGTLTDYFKSLYNDFKTKPGDHPGNYPTLSGDFYTYADKDDHYWSGYYTSRPLQKNLDRVLESHLRGAEIIFSLTTAQARRDSDTKFQAEALMEKLIQARRNLGLFQHHDGITGTAKDFVVNDYGVRLLSALNDVKLIIKECATFLALDKKTEYDMATPIFNVDETRAQHDSLPEKTVISVGDEGSAARPVLFYNSMGQGRDQVVKIYVDSASVEVRDNHGNVVISQVDPFWVNKDTIAHDKFKVSFSISMPAVSILRYSVRRVASNSRNIPASVVIFNAQSQSPIRAEPFSVDKVRGTDITLENPYLKATFSGANGMLMSVTTKKDGVNHNMKVEFITYGTSRHHGDWSGAYLFLPDGPAKTLVNGPPVVHITQGPVVSEVHVHFDVVEHVVRLYNSSGIDGVSLDIANIADITTKANFELGVRVTTDIGNKEKEFFTDLNGFQISKHKYYDKLTPQGNFYPMPTMSFIEDETNRFSILSGNSLGVTCNNPGVLEVMLDRRLDQDDSRGLQQGVRDNRRTPSRFKLLLEHRNPGKYNKDSPVAHASLLAHQTSLQLIHQVFVIPPSSAHVALPSLSSFSAMANELPCDVHLLNLRTQQNRDDGSQRLIPRPTAGLFLHRLGVDCAFGNKGLLCEHADGKVVLGNMFSAVQTTSAQQVSLTLMHDEEAVDPAATLDLEPMEISSFVVSLQ